MLNVPPLPSSFSRIEKELDRAKFFRNQGTRMMAGMEIRRCGSATRSLEMSRRASGEIHGGKSNSALKTFLYMFMTFSSWNGKNPASRTKRTTPHDHMSALAPSYLSLQNYG